jgi:hypothetical protein
MSFSADPNPTGIIEIKEQDYLMPNGTKIERKYFYANITFLVRSK